MRRWKSKLSLSALLLAFAAPAVADSVTAQRPIRMHAVIVPEDVVLTGASASFAITRIEDAVGLEAKRNIFPGQPILSSDVGPITLIERNQIVELLYDNGSLRISTDGRALGRAALGERVRVMNIESKKTVSGTVSGPSTVEVN